MWKMCMFSMVTLLTCLFKKKIVAGHKMRLGKYFSVFWRTCLLSGRGNTVTLGVFVVPLESLPRVGQIILSVFKVVWDSLLNSMKSLAAFSVFQFKSLLWDRSWLEIHTMHGSRIAGILFFPPFPPLPAGNTLGKPLALTDPSQLYHSENLCLERQTSTNHFLIDFQNKIKGTKKARNEFIFSITIWVSFT